MRNLHESLPEKKIKKKRLKHSLSVSGIIFIRLLFFQFL